MRDFPRSPHCHQAPYRACTVQYCTASIYAINKGSGRVGEAQYKGRDANNNKRERNAKCEMRVRVRMQMWMRCLSVPVSPLLFNLLSPPLQPPYILLSSASSKWQRTRRCSNANSAPLQLASPRCLTSHQSS